MQNHYQQPNPVNQPSTPHVFKFLSYYLDKRSRIATFCYQGIDKFIFTERITFAPHPVEGRRFNVLEDPGLNELLDRALFLSFILIGTSYYKVHPTATVRLDLPIDHFQAYFFNKVFQEGLSQFAFENKLARSQLAHFTPVVQNLNPQTIAYKGQGILSLQSGGKDSLLTASLLRAKGLDFTPWYVTSSSNYDHPDIIDHLASAENPHPASLVLRELDLAHLRTPGSLNGHVPVTMILESLAIVQAILNNQNVILTSIGQEGSEPHSFIGDLPVNHQWSKTWEAEQLLAEYIKRYISPDLIVGSPLRSMSELYITEQFIQRCWQTYGFAFSSCNQANYKQKTNNNTLKWCGECAKCANTYLLFAPFLPPHLLQALFVDKDLFKKESLIKSFKGLLGVDGVMKPFECVGSVNELRTAYHHRQPGYGQLPFSVPVGNFDYRQLTPMQESIRKLVF